MGIIYRQSWTSGTFSQSSGYQSSAFGGPDAPITGYPELGLMENVHTVAGAGPGGENVVDALNTAQYLFAGVALSGIGPLTSDQYDARGLIIEWDMQLMASALNEAGTGQPLMLGSRGDGTPSTGLFTSERFIEFRIEQTAGAAFTYQLHYRHFTGSISSSGTSMSSPITGSAGTADDAWHHFKMELTPSTVTGGFAGDGTLGSATVASDGAVTISVDGVSVITATGLNFVVNYQATANPDLYYGNSLFHGESDLPGAVTNTILRYDAGLIASRVWGVKGTIQGATRAILFSIDNNTNVLDEDGKFKICGDFEVTGTTTLGALVAAPGSIALDDLSDVAITSPAALQVLAYNGSGQWVNTNAVGQILTVSVTLTDAQIKALPTTGIQLVAAPVGGVTLLPDMILLVSNFTAGAYGNVDVDGYMVAQFGTDEWSTYIANDPANSLTFLDTFLAATASRATLREFAATTDPADEWGPLAYPIGVYANTALNLKISNGSSGNLTGGNAANTLKAFVTYQLVTV